MDSTENKQQERKDFFLKKCSEQSKDVNIAIYKNKAILLRNHLFEWCLNMFGGCDLNMYSLHVIITQNSTHLKSNEELEIFAAVAQVTKKPQPIVFINNKEAYVSNDGIAEYKIKVGDTKGKFSKDVSIIFTRPDGQKDTVTKQITYTVD